eukprot:TRINITY_DN3128_c0_g1_i2.p1 TRINITY_DN3128_c0_g1~~TRINITY_DN3128_c0_g1_i2.p1  ORF type:complete len:305 (+),score=66.68 TRINITY_DN3128_c0_g1_i2:97-915(+)
MTNLVRTRKSSRLSLVALLLSGAATGPLLFFTVSEPKPVGQKGSRTAVAGENKASATFDKLVLEPMLARIASTSGDPKARLSKLLSKVLGRKKTMKLEYGVGKTSKGHKSVVILPVLPGEKRARFAEGVGKSIAKAEKSAAASALDIVEATMHEKTPTTKEEAYRPRLFRLLQQRMGRPLRQGELQYGHRPKDGSEDMREIFVTISGAAEDSPKVFTMELPDWRSKEILTPEEWQDSDVRKAFNKRKDKVFKEGKKAAFEKVAKMAYENIER